MNISIVISIIALMLSSVSILWNIFQYVHSRKTIVKIFHRAATETYFEGNITTNATTKQVHVFNIVSVNAHKTVINQIKFFYDSSEKFQVHFPEQDAIQLPHTLEQGVPLVLKVDRNGTDMLEKQKKTSRVRLVVSDTIGRRFYSQWIYFSKCKFESKEMPAPEIWR